LVPALVATLNGGRAVNTFIRDRSGGALLVLGVAAANCMAPWVVEVALTQEILPREQLAVTLPA
jgi:hypothetical protein